MFTDSMRLPDGSSMPRFGQGTWQMAEDDRRRSDELAGLIYGLRSGIKMIDTAEMYGEGRAEWLAGEAIRRSGVPRSQLTIVDKVYPENANERRIYGSVDKSLALLGTDYIDMYLLHWRGDCDLEEMGSCMERLVKAGKIRHWGVSNFDVQDMEDLWKTENGRNCAVNQILYNLGCRGPEYDLIPWLRSKGIPFMAYCPIGQAGNLITQDGVSKAEIVADPNVRKLAEQKRISVPQLLLAFVLRDPDCAAIPKAVSQGHINENIKAKEILLTQEELSLLAESFPEPRQKMYFEKY